jgi:hypothetical protein
MPVTSAVLTEAQALLNDVDKKIFTDAALLPLIRKAYQELQDELALNSLGEVFEGDLYVGAAHDAANQLSTSSLPSDFIMPMEIWQRPGIDGILTNHPDFQLMKEYKFSAAEAESAQGHKYWYWEDNKIVFSGSTIDITMKIKYMKHLSAIVDVNTVIPTLNSQTYLAARTAAIAAIVIGGNVERSEVYQADATIRLNKLIQIAVKRNQANPTRRQPFKAHQ